MLLIDDSMIYLYSQVTMRIIENSSTMVGNKKKRKNNKV